MRGAPPDVGAVLRALSGANVQFIVVGDVDGERPLRVVVSRHPTNLEALGRALDGLGSVLREAADPADPADIGPTRLGDPLATVGVATDAGDVDILFGGPRQSLYAETLTVSEERDVTGLSVRWADAPAPLEPPPRVTSRMLGKRLLSLAEGLAHLMDRRDAGPQADGESAPEGS
jgi:hypothetical protein